MDCRYCGEAAGFLRTRHVECENRHHAARSNAVNIVMKAACEGSLWPNIESPLRQIMQDGWVPPEMLDKIFVEGLEAAERKVLDDDLLDEEEERNVTAFLDSAPASGLESAAVALIRGRLGRASVIRTVLEGKNPAERLGPVHHGFKFMKSEDLVWFFDGVEYEITKTRVSYSGGSRGMSFRVAKGVYMRTGAIKGERHVTEERHLVDAGQLAITTKCVYFRGESHRFRVRHDRVVSYDPLVNGFELTRDRANARPERFYTGDGWFTINLLMNAEDLA